MSRPRTFGGRRLLPGELAVRELLLRPGILATGAYRRSLRGTTFVGVTGSVGKTTTKDLAAAILGAGLPGTMSLGNKNRLSSIGRVILRTRRSDRFCVVEVATWRAGSVAQIARLVRPRIGVVTRIGIDHYKVFRGVEAVAAEKRALIDALPADGVAVLNADDPCAIAMADGFPGRVISFGTSPGATLRAEDVRSSWPDPLSFTLRTDGRSLPVRTRLHGKHSALVVLAALGVAVAMDVPLEPALDVVAAFEPSTNRMSEHRQGGVTFIRDDQKAGAWSFDPLLEFVADARAARTILVVGTLSDYPGSTSTVYARIARAALAAADEVVFVGRNAERVRGLEAEAGGRLRRFATVREAAGYFQTALRDGDLVVLKGSNRADHLARILLARETEVLCWRESCGRVTICDTCELLRVPE